MKKEINQKPKSGIALSVIAIISGAALMIYMIMVEDEPGALPLFLIITGMIFLIINRNQIKKHRD